MSRILITGASGMVGRRLVRLLCASGHDVIATDLAPSSDLPTAATFARMDVSSDDPMRIVCEEAPDAVIHLASVLEPKDRDLAYRVDVVGTRHVLEACLRAKVRRLVVTSSGAAYGYHADNAPRLTEEDPIRGNPEFAYSDHKRQVENILAEARRSAPQLEQVVLRVCTVLGAGVENQITALFRKPRLIALSGSESPFVFIWTEDLARILERAATQGPPRCFQCCGRRGAVNGAAVCHAWQAAGPHPGLGREGCSCHRPSTGPVPVRPGASAVPAIPACFGQRRAEDPVWLHAEALKRRSL